MSEATGVFLYMQEAHFVGLLSKMKADVSLTLESQSIL